MISFSNRLLLQPTTNLYFKKKSIKPLGDKCLLPVSCSRRLKKFTQVKSVKKTLYLSYGSTHKFKDTATKIYCTEKDESVVTRISEFDNVAVSTSEGSIELDDEIEPLREALERSKKKAAKSAFKRESLEAEAQELAGLAIEAIDVFERAKNKLYSLLDSRETVLVEKEKLNTELETIKEKLNILSSSNIIAESKNGTISESEVLPQEKDGGQSVENEDINISDKTIEVASEIEENKSKYNIIENRISELNNEIGDLDIKIHNQRDRVMACKSVARDAEARVQSVMAAAANAVTAELESQAVLKETQNAFMNAMLEINVLTTQDVEFESEKIKNEMKQILEDNEASRRSRQASIKAKVDEVLEVPENLEKSRGTIKINGDGALEFLSKNKTVLVGIFAAIALGILLLNSAAGKAYLASISSFLQTIWKDPSIIVSYMVPAGHGAEAGLYQSIWLLLASVIMVPLVCKVLPGATPVLGFLAAGALVGPNALGIIKDINEVRHLAELGVVFLLFNIGLELSLERLQSMAKFVFGLGSAQVLITTAAVAFVAATFAGISGAGSIILGAALALSSTAVAMQVLQERGETGTRHGRATFSILLLQDLAVVVVLMLIPLLAKQASGGSGGILSILQALGKAGIKAVLCIAGIILGGRILVRPIYKMISNFHNKEIFSALTLFFALGSSVLTQAFGLSLALGAFLAGLLLAETDYVIQVESDIEPYKGVLMGLFFMTVGMEISISLFINNWSTILTHLVVLMGGKIALMCAIGKVFGLSDITSFRSGLLLGAGGEFAFVAFGEAVQYGLLPAGLISLLYMTVSLSMALIPYMAILGAAVCKNFEKGDVKAMQPKEDETSHFKDHVIIAGFGRVGQLISQLLSERMIPFIALDIFSDRVQKGKTLDLPVYFGDAGSEAVLHSVGADRAACVVVALDSPGSNYRCVWTMNRHFPKVKTYVRAFDLEHAKTLEKAGAAVVVPETLEPSLQLAASVLLQAKTPPEEIGSIIDEFRREHIQEFMSITEESGFSIGYGFGSNKEAKKIDIKSKGDADIAFAQPA